MKVVITVVCAMFLLGAWINLNDAYKEREVSKIITCILLAILGIVSIIFTWII